jgi:hypothetical protein
MVAKILFAAVAQPHPQHLGDLVFFRFRQRVVKGEGLFPFTATSPVVVGVPIAAGHANAPTDFFDQGVSLEGSRGGVHGW